MDSIVHFENERFVGRTNFHSGLLNSLVVLSVKDVEGVAKMCPYAFQWRRVFNRSLRSGVSVNFDFDGVVIDVWVWTIYGYSAADVSYRIQESVINTVQGLVEDKVKHVNVRINGIQQKEVA